MVFMRGTNIISNVQGVKVEGVKGQKSRGMEKRVELGPNSAALI